MYTLVMNGMEMDWAEDLAGAASLLTSYRSLYPKCLHHIEDEDGFLVPASELWPEPPQEPQAPVVAQDLEQWDWIVVNSSAGKDSQAMLDHVVGLAREAGVLDRVVVVHADLGRMEWAGTRELAQEQAAHYGVRFEVVSRSQDLLDQVEQRGMFPSSTTRFCTSDHKRDQVAPLFTRLAREAGRPVRILNCMGLRADESSSRAKRAPFSRNTRSSSSRKDVWEWLPIHGWTASQVWATIRASGVRYHHAYDLGMPRLSCCFCIFATRPALMLAGKHNPQLLDQYVAVESLIGHSFKKDLSLASIQQALAAGEQPGPVVDWSMS